MKTRQTRQARAKILFLCTHNSARSQMAEGLLRALGGDAFEALSAGSVATEVRDEARQVMSESGIELVGQESKTLDRYLYEPIDLVVTVCDGAKASCPVFPHSVNSLHWSIDDPSGVAGSPEERLMAFRQARDELRRRIESEILGLKEKSG